MPRVDALTIGREHTLQAGELLAEELPHGETWVLVLGPTGSAAVPKAVRSCSGVSVATSAQRHGAPVSSSKSRAPPPTPQNGKSTV